MNKNQQPENGARKDVEQASRHHCSPEIPSVVKLSSRQSHCKIQKELSRANPTDG